MGLHQTLTLLRPFGEQTSIRALGARLRCERDGMNAEIRVLYPDPETAARRGDKRLIPQSPFTFKETVVCPLA